MATRLDPDPDTHGIKHSMISFALLLFVICTIQFYFAAAHTWVWPFYVAVMAVAYVIHLWHRKSATISLSKAWLICVGFFFAWTAFQSMPLPVKLLAGLSPNRHAVLMQSASLTGLPVKWGTISYNIEESMAWWILMIVLWGVYLIFRDELTHRRRLTLLITVFFAVAFLQSIYGILQSLIPNMGVLGLPGGHMGYARGTYFNRNHFAGFIEMMFPLCLGYMLSYREWKIGGNRIGNSAKNKKVVGSGGNQLVFLWAVIMIMMLLATLFSQSRAGILGILLGVFVFSLLVRTAHKKVAHRLWFGLAVILGMTLLYGFRIGFEGLIDRFMDIGDGNDRTSFWLDSLPIFKDHPLGIGLMNFKSVFRVYEESTSFIGTVRHTHNDILQLLIETGWPGFIALFGGFLVLIYKKIIQVIHMRPQNDPMHFFLATGALCGLISIGFHSFFDFNLQIPANMVYFVILLAILNVCTEEGDMGRQRE